jgi:phosphoribosyl 1,2-cyclic phosphate phosphodiesterase
MNQDWTHWPPKNQLTDVYLPGQVATDFRRFLGVWNHLFFHKNEGLIRLIELADGQSIALNGYVIRPFRLKQDFVYAFTVTYEHARVLIAPDELYGWDPADELTNRDLIVVPMGLMEYNPVTGQRNIPANHPVLKQEATYEQTLSMVRKIKPKRAVLTHIEEPDQVSIEELRTIEQQLRTKGLPISFAYDTMAIEV